MTVFAALLRRDLAQMFGGGGRGATLLPVLFFIAVAMLFPFAVGPAPELLARTGGGVIWVAALLASILPVELGLLAGTPGLAAIGLIIAALTVGMRSGAALAGLLLIPLAVPLLVFGAGALSTGGASGIALTAAISLLLVAVTPFAGGAAIRAAREG